MDPFIPIFGLGLQWQGVHQLCVRQLNYMERRKVSVPIAVGFLIVGWLMTLAGLYPTWTDPLAGAVPLWIRNNWEYLLGAALLLFGFHFAGKDVPGPDGAFIANRFDLHLAILTTMLGLTGLIGLILDRDLVVLIVRQAIGGS